MDEGLQLVVSAIAQKYPNLRAHEHNFLSPPPGHITGDRVVLNSPHFGGLESEERMQRFIASIDSYLEQGGFFYSLFDNLLFGWDARESFEVKIGRLLTQLHKKFGRDNVSTVPLASYSDHAQLDLMKPVPGSLQIRKP